MKQYYLQIKSKNEKSLRKLLLFFSKGLKPKFKIFNKIITNQNSKKRITLLKSPHVNKTAQEHFEEQTFTKQILLKSFYFKTSLITLKKNLNLFFQDISIQLKFVIDKPIELKNRFAIFYLDNFQLFSINKNKFNRKRGLKKTFSKKFYLKRNSFTNLLKLLNIISVFGELILLKLNKHCLNSSVVEQRTENP